MMYAICDSGTITTNSCYSEASKFVSQNGSLNLQNVHKVSEMYLLEAGGHMTITGFHGTLLAKSKGGCQLQFQLTELYGDSCIEVLSHSFGDSRLQLNVSEFVEEHTKLEIIASEIELTENMKHLQEYIQEPGVLRMEQINLELSDDKLKVITSGSVKLGKMSWADTVRQKMNLTSDKV